jgi:hypothetical protein
MKQGTSGICIGPTSLVIGLIAGGAQAQAQAPTQTQGQAQAQAQAETTLPEVKVTGPKWETHHGGYVISSNFNIDPKMSAVIFPAEPFQKGDIFDFRTMRMDDDD